MLNYLRGKIQRWAAKQQKDELQYFVDMLKGAELGGVALTVALATDFKNVVMTTSDFEKTRKDGMACVFLVKTYQRLQKMKFFPNAAGVAVWLHTERAYTNLTLVPLAKEMWSLLSGAFPYVEEAAYGYEKMLQKDLNLSGFWIIPDGFK